MSTQVSCFCEGENVVFSHKRASSYLVLTVRVTAFQSLCVSLETVVYYEYSITVLQGLLAQYLISGACTNADSDRDIWFHFSTRTIATNETRFGYFKKVR